MSAVNEVTDHQAVEPGPSAARRVTDASGNDVFLKPLDLACLQHGKLHPNVKERLARIRELPLRDIALLHGVEVIDGQPMLVWDWLPGVPLAAAERFAPGLARDLSLLVDAVHAHGLVHGAIHARNFILDSAGKPRLTHFSPLLHYDPSLDRDGLANLLHELNLTEPEPPVPAPATRPRWRTILGSASLWLAVLLTAASIAAGVWIYHIERRLEPQAGSAIAR